MFAAWESTSRPSPRESREVLHTAHAHLAALGMRYAVAEGRAFPTTHWTRREGSWRFREESLGTGVSA